MESLYSELYDKYKKLKTRKESEMEPLNHDQEINFMNCVSGRSAKDGQCAEYQKLLMEENQKKMLSSMNFPQSVGQSSGAKSTTRGRAFSIEEDKILCKTWLEISQNLIPGANQKKDKLWERIFEIFESRRPNYGQAPRTLKSLQCRMCSIMKVINKFRGCIRQVENLNPSGASELDILSNAKVLFAQDPDEKKGFLFDHLWPILKDAEKWANPIPKQRQLFEYSEGSETRTPTSKSPRTPSFVDLNADEDEQTSIEVCADSSGRPMRRKKENMRKRRAADKSELIVGMFEKNGAILETLKRGEIKRNERFAQMNNDATIRYNVMMLQAENERNKLKLRRERQERDFMEKDLNSISDPVEREYFRGKKLEIVEKMARHSQVGGSSTTFSQYQGGYGGER
ncbi:hypothetical protein HHK36_017239 [Tetracentron sinense]|uniref:No apical meristem-associated C-terminal domain-containing protein n=1 Tax=Tetracentron sinense TaxID=13715 RepID=A0A835DF06_TETSI|nr:hypothetical protein HHK36_017239 [Tetracentron sinense]